MASNKIAVLYGTKGGMGDVGKLAVVHAVSRLGPENVQVVAMSAESTEGQDLGYDLDVQVDKEATHQAFKDAMSKVEVIKVDVESDAACAQIEQAINGAGAVVACLQNRLSNKKPRWLASGAAKITAAMNSKGINRLVILSSMGIGEDFLPFSTFGTMIAVLLRTMLRDVRKDLIAQEQVVEKSNLDYLLVRPVCIDPNYQRKDKWALLTSHEDCRRKKGLHLFVSKWDVALFMVGEAINPTFHSTAVTIGAERH